jgi:regulator of replication initiation timing
MTYKWEVIAQDLTEERDRLLKENSDLRHDVKQSLDAQVQYLAENKRLRKALEEIAERELYTDAPAEGALEVVVLSARAALKSEKQ